MMIDPAFAQSADQAGQYGSLDTLVANAGFLIAATYAISVGWMKRSGSKWIPPDEAVPKATTRTAALVTMVFLAIMFFYLRAPETHAILTTVTLISLALTLTGLFSTIYIMTAYGFPTTRPNWRGKEKPAVVLGGSKLRDEAQKIANVRGTSITTLYEESNGKLHLVFEQDSIAKIHWIATATFIAFQAFGSLSLAGAGLLLSFVST